MHPTRHDTPTPPRASLGLTDLGRVRVLRALAEAGQLTRFELVNETGLTRGTVSSVIWQLINAGLVREDTTSSTKARYGRPPQLLSLEPGSGYALGLDITHDHVRTILADVGGTVRWDRTEQILVDHHPTQTLDLAQKLIDTALTETNTPRDKILGLGAGFACPVDKNGHELHAENIMDGWIDVLPVDELTRRTGLPVQIINDANAGVLAEHRYGAARGCNDVLYLRLSCGIGAGAICDGRMLLGHAGIAGELGHVTVDRRGLLCRCGNRGCLETIASPRAVAELLTHHWSRPVTSDDLPELMHGGDRGTVRAVEDAGEAVGQALATVVMVLNPEMIVVGGDLAAAGDMLLDPIRRTITRSTMHSHTAPLTIVTSALGDNASVRGAAAHVLRSVPTALALASRVNS